MLNSNNFYEILNPIFYISKLFGLAPFKLNRKCYKTSRLNIFYSISVATSTYVFSTIALHNRPTLNAGVISRVTETIDSHLNHFGVCFIIVSHCIYSKMILNSVQDINQFDKTFSRHFRINLKSEYKKNQKYIMITLVTTIIYLLTCVLFTIKATIRSFTLEQLGDIVLYTGPSIISTFTELQFCTLVLCLKQRFVWVNEIIRETNKTDKPENNSLIQNIFTTIIGAATPIITDESTQDKMLIIFENIRYKHHVLCTILKNINRSFSFQILYIILQNFLTVMLGLFYIGRRIIIEKVIGIEYILYASDQIILSLVQLIAIVVACSTTVAEAQKIGHLIHIAASNHCKCANQLSLETSYFSLQLLHHKVEFTACGIFGINENLLLSIVGAITTYLVIVIQFELSDTFQKSK